MVAFKPYKRGNETLWRLNKLSNVSKHESFVRAVLVTSEITYNWPGGTLTKGLSRDGAENEIPVAWIRRGTPQPYHNLKLDTSIRFNDIGDLVFNEPAIKLLHDLVGITDRIILGVEAEARRIGLYN